MQTKRKRKLGDDLGPILDGEVLDCGSLNFMDDQRAPAQLHRPGSLPMSDADRTRKATLYDKHDKEISERWKNPPPVAAAPSEVSLDSPRPIGDARATAYAAYEQRISCAWRHR